MTKLYEAGTLIKPGKPKSPQKENMIQVQSRDTFQTPNYGTELLLPFLFHVLPGNFRIWECAAGKRKMSNVLSSVYDVISTDLQDEHSFNFLTDIMSFPFDCIVTNPPFSLKRKFYQKCRSYNVPFALLIPADYSGWIIKEVQDGAEKIIPTRRIDYITPTGLSGENGHTSYFHSMWLTWGFRLGKTETFVELTNKMKENI